MKNSWRKNTEDKTVKTNAIRGKRDGQTNECVLTSGVKLKKKQNKCDKKNYMYTTNKYIKRKIKNVYLQTLQVK